jgi:hypothetical protein
MGNIVQMGQGQAGETMAGLGDIARQAQSVAGAQARTSQVQNLSNQQMIGSAIGTGLGLYTAFGDS